MIYGVGLDIVEVDRLRQALSRRPALLRRVFTAAELAYCEGAPPQRLSRLAARFAAKEAALKALGTGLRYGKWVEVEVVRDHLGRPGLVLHGNIAGLAARLGVSRLVLSLSHTRAYACAQVLALKEVTAGAGGVEPGDAGH